MEKPTTQGSICWNGNDPSRNLSWPGKLSDPLRAWKHGQLWEQASDGAWFVICVACHRSRRVTDHRGRAVCDACIERVPEEWMS